MHEREREREREIRLMQKVLRLPALRLQLPLPLSFFLLFVTKEVDWTSVEAVVLNLWQTACAFSADGGTCAHATNHVFRLSIT